MSYLLDTCVVSELMKPTPEVKVVNWLSQTPERENHLSVITLGELKRGIEKLPASPRRLALEQWLRDDITQRFAGRLIALDVEIMLTWGALSARREKAGRKLPAIDGLIAASALTRGLTLVTRNVSDFESTGVALLNPWD